MAQSDDKAESGTPRTNYLEDQMAPGVHFDFETAFYKMRDFARDLEREAEESAKRTRGWHRAVETAGTLMGLPGGLGADEFTQEVQARESARSASAHLDAIADVLGYPRESWRISGCDFLAHAVKALQDNYIATRDAQPASRDAIIEGVAKEIEAAPLTYAGPDPNVASDLRYLIVCAIRDMKGKATPEYVVERAKEKNDG